jgi:HSP20 family protein
MFTFTTDFDRGFSVFDELRRRMDRVWDDFDGQADGPSVYASSAWPKLNVYDTGSAVVLRADVPGLSEKDIQLTVTGNAVSLSGERRVTPPEGYSVQRQERGALRFSRSFALPCKVDADKTQASLKDGVLTVTLAKTPEAQPRQIAVRAS